ncbi:MAG: hypothetical protein RIC06_25075 [Cyclobacteriaceae bacterium]
MTRSANTNNKWRTESQISWLRDKLEKAEKSGFTTDRRDEILKASKNIKS